MKVLAIIAFAVIVIAIAFFALLPLFSDEIKGIDQANDDPTIDDGEEDK